MMYLMLLAGFAIASNSGPIEVKSDTLQVRRQKEPKFPKEGLGGVNEVTCKAWVLIDKKGKPTSVDVVDCGDEFHALVEKALKKWRWAPPIVDGKNTDVKTAVVFIFLEDEPVEESPIEKAEATVELMESCMHWAGEEPYSEERAEEIQKGLKMSCDAAEKAAKENYDTLVADPEQAAALVAFASHVMVKDLGPVEPLCASAEVHWLARRATGEEFSAPYFEQMCPPHAARVKAR